VAHRSAQGAGKFDLELDGEDLLLMSVKINGKALSEEAYSVSEGKLKIFAASLPTDAKKTFELETTVKLSPEKNLALSGLYTSGGSLLCTQCEAMGFRRIAYHLDRPDVLTKYKVRLEADKAAFPLLLSNGNMIESGPVVDGAKQGRHYAIWEDPFPKPSYLFALVAGDLGAIHSTYTTKSGRVVKLGIFSDKENAGKLEHAMYSIKESLKWDEDTFGLECDLDVYNIVATNDFNMGAMENKGLNIFNSAYVLADPATATDVDYERILGVIAHEYFHNWTGNRVTVRDWFQLTLKEGLTVFRDQWFSSDVTSHAVKRIEDVRGLRGRQFLEDQGPMAHPIRPESYISMDNFYTGTVYVKGAEVVRMYRTLLGDEGFKKGMALYFERHDGSAVTCDDFRAAMADANHVDLAQFERWYSQAGTPIVSVKKTYDEAKKRFTLTLKQHTPTTPGPNQKESDKKPLLIPFVFGLLSAQTGQEILPSQVLQLTEAEQTFVFEGIGEKPVASLLRDFSAPVKVVLEEEQSVAELAFLMAHDTDSFNRWDAGNRLSTRIILSLANAPSVSGISSAPLPAEYIDAIRTVLSTCSAPGSDPSLVAYALQLPDELTLSQDMQVIDVEKLHAARGRVKKALAQALKAEFEAAYENAGQAEGANAKYEFSAAEVGRRRLRNTCLDYLSSERSAASAARSKLQFDSSNCMTDNIAALGCLVSQDCPERTAALASFHTAAKGDALVLNKWFAIQAMADLPGLLDTVKALKQHPDFIISNPNRARSLISTFAGNMAHFHAADGQGYKFVADCIMELDKLNPQVAARLAQAFAQWKRFDVTRQQIMKSEMERIQSMEGLSKDTGEVIMRLLK